MTDDIPRTPPSYEALCVALTAEREDPLAQLFHGAGLARPRLLWSPRPQEFGDPRLRRFRQYAGPCGPGEGVVPRGGFLDGLPDDLRAGAILVDFSADDQMVYVHFGRDVADQYGRALSGPVAGQMPPYIELFYRAVFHAARARREPVLTEHEPPPHVFVQAWQRLVVPLVGQGAKIGAFAVMNVAINPLRAGLDAVHEAVYVLSDTQQVLYANPPARLLMPQGDGRARGGDFFAETGVPLPQLASPADMLGQRMVEARRSLSLRGTLLTDVVVTVSATMHRTEPVYIVILRPEG